MLGDKAGPLSPALGPFSPVTPELTPRQREAPPNGRAEGSEDTQRQGEPKAEHRPNSPAFLPFPSCFPLRASERARTQAGPRPLGCKGWIPLRLGRL